MHDFGVDGGRHTTKPDTWGTSVNIIAGAAALAAVLLLPLCVAAVSILMKFLGMRRPVRVGLAICALLLCAGLVWLFGSGRAVVGTLAPKSEQIQIAQTGLLPSVLHVLRVVVTVANCRTTDRSVAMELTLAVDASTFDRLSSGQRVPLREYCLGPLAFARFAESPPWAVLPLPETQRFWPWYDPSDKPRGRVRHALAQVTGVRTVREALLLSWTQRGATWVFPLPQPYDEATLQLENQSGAVVTTIDRVDAGSAPSLAVGETLSVIVADGRWREARLAVGTRRYAAEAWHQRLRMLLPQMATTLLLAVLVALGLFKFTRRHVRRSTDRRPVTTR